MIDKVIEEYFINLLRMFFTKIFNWKGTDAIIWILVIDIVLFITVMPMAFDIVSIHLTTLMQIALFVAWIIAFYFSLNIVAYFVFNPNIYKHEYDELGLLIKIQIRNGHKHKLC